MKNSKGHLLIIVKVKPDSKKQEVVKTGENSFLIKVKQKPIEGKATKAVIDILAEYFKIKKSNIKLIKGGKLKNKIFEIKKD